MKKKIDLFITQAVWITIAVIVSIYLSRFIEHKSADWFDEEPKKAEVVSLSTMVAELERPYYGRQCVNDFDCPNGQVCFLNKCIY